MLAAPPLSLCTGVARQRPRAPVLRGCACNFVGLQVEQQRVTELDVSPTAYPYNTMKSCRAALVRRSHLAQAVDTALARCDAALSTIRLPRYQHRLPHLIRY